MFMAKEYVSWRFKAHGKAGVHPPFLFRLCDKVFSRKNQIPEQERIESIRRKLLNDTRTIEVQDFGAGSKVSGTHLRSIAEIAKGSAKTKKWASVLYQLAAERRPAQIIELGTSLGISTLYMASAIPSGKVISLEGSANISREARKNVQDAGLSNVEIRTGHFDETLPQLLEETQAVEFAYIDGNHTEAATLRYFELFKHKATDYTVLIFDDIHWSEGMKNAWEKIKRDEQVRLSVDFFQLGMVFFNRGLSKQHFNIRL